VRFGARPGSDPRIVVWDLLWRARWSTFLAAMGAHLLAFSGLKIGFVTTAGMNGGGEMAIVPNGIQDYVDGGYAEQAIRDGLRSVWTESETTIRAALGTQRQATAAGSVIVGGVQMMDTLIADFLATVGPAWTILSNASYNLTDAGVTITAQRAHRNITWLVALCEQPVNVDNPTPPPNKIPDPDPVGTVRAVFESAISTEGFAVIMAHADALGVDNQITSGPWPLAMLAPGVYPGVILPTVQYLAGLLQAEMTDAPDVPSVVAGVTPSRTSTQHFTALVTTTNDTMLARPASRGRD
jgi:hypothetical protein